MKLGKGKGEDTKLLADFDFPFSLFQFPVRA